MSPTKARIVMIVSLVALAAVAVLWITSASGEPRADLVGSSVTTTTVDAPPNDIVPPSSVPTGPPGAAVVPAAAPQPGVPQRLTIPSLDLDDLVVPVGLEADGAMTVPPAELAGWYLHGPRPGADAGSSVIAAHVDFNGEPGVFLELARLEVGAEVRVSDDAGAARDYVVVERFQVGKDELPIDELFRTDGAHVLTLITCGGSFDRADRRYADNIVVRAIPV